MNSMTMTDMVSNRSESSVFLVGCVFIFVVIDISMNSADQSCGLEALSATLMD